MPVLSQSSEALNTHRSELYPLKHVIHVKILDATIFTKVQLYRQVTGMASSATSVDGPTWHVCKLAIV